MAFLTEAQLAVARVDLGTDMNEDDLQERYDRIGDLTLAIIEVVRQRLADLLAAPADFKTPDYSQNTIKNIDMYEQILHRLKSDFGGIPLVRAVQPRRTYR